MKLRIRGDSLRLRLTKSEVSTLAERGVVEESIAFGPSTSQELSYAVRVGPATQQEELVARIEGTRIEVLAKPDTVRSWTSTSSEVIGLEAEQTTSSPSSSSSSSPQPNNELKKRTLRILIEKDFACLQDRGPLEDDSDAFPNPKA